MFGRNLFLALAMLGLLAVPASAVIMLDVGPATSTVMPGWTGIDKWNDYAHAVSGSYLGPVNLGGGVTAGFANGFDFSTYDRGAAAISGSPLNALGMNDLLRDFVQFSTVGKYLQVKGLAPGDYDVTLYATDPNYLTESAKSLYVNGTNVFIGPVVGSPTLDEISATVTVTVDSTGILNIGRGTGGNPSKINGVIIAAVPEPVSLALLLAGLGLAIVRRR
jgi:hypothetical protein